MNTLKSALRRMSQHTLEERLDALASMRAKTYDYRHVFEDDDPIVMVIQTEIDNVVTELERREAQ